MQYKGRKYFSNVSIIFYQIFILNFTLNDNILLLGLKIKCKQPLSNSARSEKQLNFKLL